MGYKKLQESKSGFTLVEILLVITILAILGIVTIIATNPARHIAKSRDSERTANVNSILIALHRYTVDHNGNFPPVISVDELEICRTDSIQCSGLYDLSDLTDGQEYLVSIPIDPLCSGSGQICSENGSGYFLKKTAGGKVTILAPHAEVVNEISVTR